MNNNNCFCNCYKINCATNCQSITLTDINNQPLIATLQGDYQILIKHLNQNTISIQKIFLQQNQPLQIPTNLLNEIGTSFLIIFDPNNNNIKINNHHCIQINMTPSTQ